MSVPAPHFLLFSEASRKQRQGQWRFLLKAVDGTEQLEVADAEPEARGERLELLAVVRGLEALDQPSRVTLVTSSKYVHRGLLYGLQEWRSNDWSWESFGEMAPVKNRDLWQRLDHALAFHELDFRPWRFDAAAPGDSLCATPREDSGESPTTHGAGARRATVPPPHARPRRDRGLSPMARDSQEFRAPAGNAGPADAVGRLKVAPPNGATPQAGAPRKAVRRGRWNARAWARAVVRLARATRRALPLQTAAP